MDYVAWLHRLQQFVAGCRARLPPVRRGECSVLAEGPLGPEELQRLRDGIDCPLPESVAGFLTRAASRLRFECVCPTEEGDLTIAGELFDYWLWRAEDSKHFAGCPDGMIESRQCALDY